MKSETHAYESGLTWRSFLGILYALFVLQPAIIYVYLVTGSIISVAALYSAIFLFTEFFASGGKPLRKQEILVLLVGSSAMVPFAGISRVFAIYFSEHPLIRSLGFEEQIPSWFVPPPGSPTRAYRTFFHPDFLMPLLLPLALQVVWICAELVMGFITREIYIKTEKLPFPMASVTAELCSTLSERDPRRLTVFLVSAVVSAIYSFLYFGVPQLGEAITWGAVTPVIIPSPWVDITYLMERMAPGSSFGIATEPSIVMTGLILPTPVILSMFIGGLAVYVVANPVLVQQGLFLDWLPGMSMKSVWERSTLNFWAGPNIGFAIAAGVIPLLLHPSYLVTPFKTLWRVHTEAEKGVLSLRLLLVVFFAATFISTIVPWILVPDFPILPLIFLCILWPFMLNIIAARAMGVTGMEINIPYVQPGLIFASGYTGSQIWYAPLYGGSFITPAVAPASGAGWCQSFKVAELTSTSPTDLVKAYLFLLPLGIVLGIIYTQLLWTVAAIPSSLFPTPFWDIDVTMKAFIMRGGLGSLSPILILGGFIAMSALTAIIDLAHIPLSAIGIVAGISVPIANSTGILIGLIIAKILVKRFGERWFSRNRSVIVAGVLTGEGIIVATSTAITMIIKAIWIKPY